MARVFIAVRESFKISLIKGVVVVRASILKSLSITTILRALRGFIFRRLFVNKIGILKVTLSSTTNLVLNMLLLTCPVELYKRKISY